MMSGEREKDKVLNCDKNEGKKERELVTEKT